MTDCSHTSTRRGKDIPRRWGSYRSEVCLQCGAFRQTDHYDKPQPGPLGMWQPAEAYAGATSELEPE